MQMRGWQIARIYAMWLLIAHCAVAQTRVPAEARSPNAQEVQLRTDLEQATEAMHKGDNAAAEQVLRHALKIDPHSIAALNNLGIVLARRGRPAEAIPLYEEALSSALTTLRQNAILPSRTLNPNAICRRGGY